MTDEEAITIATLYGASFHYNDFGHPERNARKNYHLCTGTIDERYSPVTCFGFTAGMAAKKWLKRRAAHSRGE